MSDLLFIDIETTETTDKDIIRNISDNIRPPGNIKKAETIAKWAEEKMPAAIAEAVSKTSFDGFAGSICSISWAVNEGEIKSVARSPEASEIKMLTDFWQALITDNGVNFNPRWVAHNIEFDLPFLYKRCVVNNVKPVIHMPINPKPWGRDVFCTLFQSVGLKFTGGSLDRVCGILGIGGKTEGMSGADVNQYWLDGRIEEIVEYNQQDVHLTRELYKRLNFLDKIEK